jgi:hypothetical protein
MKKTVLSVIAVFVAWTVLDFVIHGVILKSAYEATAILWRPMNEMKMNVMHMAVLIAAFSFAWIYVRMISSKSVVTGLRYGLWWGLGAGVSMGYGTYSVMPIPYLMALTWFLGSLMEGAVAGLIVGGIVKE